MRRCRDVFLQSRSRARQRVDRRRLLQRTRRQRAARTQPRRRQHGSRSRSLLHPRLGAVVRRLSARWRRRRCHRSPAAGLAHLLIRRRMRRPRRNRPQRRKSGFDARSLSPPAMSAGSSHSRPRWLQAGANAGAQASCVPAWLCLNGRMRPPLRRWSMLCPRSEKRVACASNAHNRPEFSSSNAANRQSRH